MATVVPSAGYTLRALAAPTVFAPELGDNYQIEVTNSGSKPTDGSPVTITDTLPKGVTATGINGEGGACELISVSCVYEDRWNRAHI